MSNTEKLMLFAIVATNLVLILVGAACMSINERLAQVEEHNIELIKQVDKNKELLSVHDEIINYISDDLILIMEHQ